jgi:hypothetical protein
MFWHQQAKLAMCHIDFVVNLGIVTFRLDIENENERKI